MNIWKQSDYKQFNNQIGEGYSLKIGAITVRLGRINANDWAMECADLGLQEHIRNPILRDAQLIAAQYVYERLEVLAKALPYFKQAAYPSAQNINNEEYGRGMADYFPTTPP